MFTECYADLFEAGKLTCFKKQLDVGRSVCTFAMGSRRLYDFVDHNPLVDIRSCAYTNNPYVIRAEGVHTPLLLPQCGYSGQRVQRIRRLKQISAAGGQWDIHYGAGRSKNVLALVCMAASKTLKDGTKVNNIVPHFKPGTQVSMAYNTVNWVVTEYGAVNLKGCAFWERVGLLAGIACPDFRDEIFRAAEEAKLWRASDKQFYARGADGICVSARQKQKRVPVNLTDFCFEISGELFDTFRYWTAFIAKPIKKQGRFFYWAGLQNGK